MSRMENLDIELTRQRAQRQHQIAQEGGMTDDDLFIWGGKLAQMFCTGFAFLAPSLMLWQVVL